VNEIDPPDDEERVWEADDVRMGRIGGRKSVMGKEMWRVRSVEFSSE
jgi:hypothetical protein